MVLSLVFLNCFIDGSVEIVNGVHVKSGVGVGWRGLGWGGGDNERN